MYGECVTVWCGLEWDTLRDFFFQLHGRARENRNGGIIKSSWWCMCVCHSVCVVTTFKETLKIAREQVSWGHRPG